MPQRCTCGAVLPEDARFCHRCAKPQYEEDVQRWAAEAESAPVPPAAPPAPALRISFHNSRAVLVTLIVAGGTLLGMVVAGLLSPYLAPIVLCAAGFFAVLIYRRRSPEPLTTAGGARLGWMTGLWLFLAVLVCTAILAVYIASPTGRELLRSVPNSNSELAKILDHPHDFLMSLPLIMLQAFFFVTLLPGLGGVLGAKLLTRGRPSS